MRSAAGPAPAPNAGAGPNPPGPAANSSGAGSGLRVARVSPLTTQPGGCGSGVRASVVLDRWSPAGGDAPAPAARGEWARAFAAGSDGEIVVKATPYVGYLHRAVEKLCERLTYVQQTPIVDKNDYVAPMTNEQALNMAYEKLLGVTVPRRGRWLRQLLAELQRVGLSAADAESVRSALASAQAQQAGWVRVI